MSGGLSGILAQLSGRERALLGLMALVALPLAVVFLAVLPMTEARDAARQQAREATALRDWVAGQVRQMPLSAEAASATNAEANTSEVIGLAAIEEGLIGAGLRDQITQLADRSDGGVDIALEDALFDELSRWLSDAEPRWGYRLHAFRIEAASPGLVRAQFELRVPQ
ncbi:General secretion pathway protein M [Candidatus Rhodobacter oscarellae]|uniref:General secretion pathway protein M n=1 Tax=Candidatus Rhodobacter oscarellae TaxID=1675527 RepID=A0A0J9H120_9RHOB|nr:type II secretion system protein GspM [Candidatus Rhodobacter lobularis]KMW59438.1 General secretion pathway protein M [Candidatus Rhodobacter lobularis]